jgi:lysophospholipase L1-like esterase
MSRVIEEIESLLNHSIEDSTQAKTILADLRRNFNILKSNLQETENARVFAENGRLRVQIELQEMHKNFLSQIEQKNNMISHLENNLDLQQKKNDELKKLLQDTECKNEQLIHRIVEEIGKRLCEDMKRNLERELMNLKKNTDQFNELNKEIISMKKELECKNKQLEELNNRLLELNKTKNELNQKNIAITKLENDQINCKSRLEAAREDMYTMNLRFKELISNNKLLAEETNNNLNSILNYLKRSNQKLLHENERIIYNINNYNENLKFDMYQLKNEMLIYIRNSFDVLCQNESIVFIRNFFKFIQRNLFKPFIFIFILFAAFLVIFYFRQDSSHKCEEF